ncbi:polysaccharide biosynthesis family protein [Mycobacteroides abscessus MAB_091912_2446]|uniref:Polysaccharide biosynthesis family protein n=1 Tax=Mycobacteroides abscessus MAB_091912_2446 TaxID=1335414 RepID=A0A829MNF0_9MYCO|nr:polysaccharide biosynthesis family protein [Mycobacteroides abscessus MAB_091912_2446]
MLISGGAGFIGSALSNRLVQAGYDVAVMDVLHPQVHARGRSIDLPASVRLFTGDVTHAPDWDAVLRLFEPSQVVHLAAETGTAQSLSEATRHGSVNVVGTTQLLDALSRSALVPDQLVLASSRAVYGEGAWQSGAEVFYPRPRSHAQLLAGEWDPQGPAGASATPLSSCADRTEPRPTNIYAGTKLAQEHLLASWAAAHDTNLSVLRLQNVYGPGQSLTNSYTGIVTLFARLARTKQALEVYEDGRIVRDFVFIDDVVDALFAAVHTPATERRTLDIGSGTATTIHELAHKVADICAAPEPVVVGKFRDGTCARRVAISRPQSRASGGARSGHWKTAYMRCSNGSTKTARIVFEQAATSASIDKRGHPVIAVNPELRQCFSNLTQKCRKA